MRSLLAAVDIESFPVVIFSGNRRYVRPDWPSPKQFNHAIIAVRFPGELEAPAVSKIEAGERNRAGFFLDVDFTAAAYGRTVGQYLLIFKPAVVSQRGFTHLNQTERKYAVVLEADSYRETVEVDLPQGFTVDEMPEPVDLATPFGRYRADWRVEAGKLFFKRHLELDNAVVPPEDYASLKEFFDEMIAADQSPVVLMRQ